MKVILRHNLARLLCLVAALLWGGQAFAAATLLPPGEQCFAAGTATSGGTAGFITILGAITGGSGYASGGTQTYANVPLTGGSGAGAIAATVTVTSGIVTNVVLGNPGSHYTATDVLSAANGNLGGSGSGFSIPVSAIQGSGTGMIGLLGTITGGSGGTSGTYANVALTGGLGSGATANVTVSGGAVTAVAVLNPGSQYAVGDVLSATAGTIGGVSGFSVPVSSISINASLAGGKVYFYVPNTTSFKQTWFNADQSSTHQNTNPVALDANGCAVIYGTGSYRQVLQDSLGDTIWDQTTTDTSANNNYFWAGLAAGTPNAITATDSGFNAIDGSQIGFLALSTNTGATTLNLSSYGAYPILKATTGGLSSLSGGEIIQNNPINVTFSSVNAAFLLTNPPIQSASASSAPLCGAIGYSVVNSSSTQLTVQANTAVLVSNIGQALSRNNVNVSINFATNGANGLDTGVLGANSVYYVYLIDNGAAPAGLASLSSTAPTLPTGYTYSCRLSAVPTTAGTVLFGIQTLGSRTYLTNTAQSAPFQSNTQIACSGTGNFGPFVGLPLTAISTFGSIENFGLNNEIAVLSLGNGAGIQSAVLDQAFTGVIPFESGISLAQNLYGCNASNSSKLTINGWVDNTNVH